MVEQLCLNGFTLYKYICNDKKKLSRRSSSVKLTGFWLVNNLSNQNLFALNHCFELLYEVTFDMQ